MPPAVQTRASGRVEIDPPRGAVRIGTGRSGLVLGAPPAVALRAPSARVAVPAPPRTVVLGGRQGPAGRPGQGIEIEIYIAAANLNGHRAVALDGDGQLIYADAGAGIAAIGIIRDAVLAGAEVEVWRRGRVGGFSDLATAEEYYLGDDGLLTLTAPESGVLQPLGVAASAGVLLVTPDRPIFYLS